MAFLPYFSTTWWLSEESQNVNLFILNDIPALIVEKKRLFSAKFGEFTVQLGLEVQSDEDRGVFGANKKERRTGERWLGLPPIIFFVTVVFLGHDIFGLQMLIAKGL